MTRKNTIRTCILLFALLLLIVPFNGQGNPVHDESDQGRHSHMAEPRMPSEALHNSNGSPVAHKNARHMAGQDYVTQSGQTGTYLDLTRGLDYWDEINLLILSPDQDGTEALRVVLDGFVEIKATSFPAADLPDLTVFDLLPYDVVMAFNNNQWQQTAGVSPELVGDVLAEYLDLGGLFVENSYVMDYPGSPWGLQGEYITGGYSAITQATDDVVGTFDLGVIHEPEHPMMTGVSAFGMQSLTLIQNNGVAEGATRIADWDNGEVMLATKDQVVSFNFLPMSGGEINYTGDGATLYKNAVVWLMINQAAADTPSAPADFTVEAGEQGALHASLSWVNPGETMDGQDLDDLDAINIYRDGQLIHSVSNPQTDAAESYQDDDLTEADTYIYSIRAENHAGEGLPAMVIQFVGEDLPGAPQNVVLTADGSDGVVTWEAPAEGYHGGYFDTESLSYNVVRFPGEDTLATGISEPSFTDTDVPATGNYYYAITAINHLGEGGTGESNVALLGGDDLIVFESFEGDDFPPAGWTYVNGVEHAYWEQTTHYAYHGDFCARAYQGYQSNYQADEWLITHAIDFDDPEVQLLTFFGFTTTSSPDGIRENIHILAVDQPYDNVSDLHENATLLDVVSTSNTWEEFIIDLSGLSGEQHLAFLYHITPEDNTSFAWVYIDLVMVGDFNLHTLTMEEPEGEGTVSPAVGDHEYVDDTTVPLLATPEYGWDFSHWDGDVYEPGQMQTFILMDEDKNVKAHFVPLEPTPTPHFEDFSTVATGDIPVGWTRTHLNWGGWPAANAGGSRPEMRFHWNPASDDQLFRLTTRPIDASHEEELNLSFKQYVNNFLGGYTLKVQTSTDNVSWTTEWSLAMKSDPGGKAPDLMDPPTSYPTLFSREGEEERDHGPEEVSIPLNHLAGEEEFYVSFVFQGDNSLINSWFIDDVLIADDQPLQNVTFVVENSLDGEPVSGALINIADHPEEAYTNAQGVATVQLPAGSYTALVSKEHFEDAEKPFEVADEDLTLHVELIPVDYSHNVVFNVNMADATFGEEETAFDPDAGHQVFISGSFDGDWPVPGEHPDMELAPREENPYMYTVTLKLLDGEYEYKYFVIPDGQPGWDYDEWEGEPNRDVHVTEPMMITDVWGELEVGIGEITEGSIRLYPNPAKDHFVVRAEEALKHVMLADMQGRIFYQAPAEGQEQRVHTAGLPAGIYLVRVQTVSDTQTLRIQIIY